MIFGFIYVFAGLLSILAAFVCMFIPSKRQWAEYISAGVTGTICGLIGAHSLVVLFFWLASSLSIHIHLYPAGILIGPLGPRGTDWPNLCISTVGILIGAMVGIALLSRSKQKRT